MGIPIKPSRNLIAKGGIAIKNVGRAHLGRPGQKALYGMSNLPRRYAKEDIENAATRVLTLSQPSYHALKRILERNAAAL